MVIKYINGKPVVADESIFLDAYDVNLSISNDRFIELMCIASGLEPITLAFCRGKEDIEELVYTVLYKHSDNPEVRKVVRRVFGLKQDMETVEW